MENRRLRSVWKRTLLKGDGYFNDKCWPKCVKAHLPDCWPAASRKECFNQNTFNAVGKHLATRGRPTILQNGKERKKKEKKAIIGQIIETIWQILSNLTFLTVRQPWYLHYIHGPAIPKHNYRRDGDAECSDHTAQTTTAQLGPFCSVVAFRATFTSVATRAKRRSFLNEGKSSPSLPTSWARSKESSRCSSMK